MTYLSDRILRLDFDGERVLTGNNLSVRLDHIVLDLGSFHLKRSNKKNEWRVTLIAMV